MFLKSMIALGMISASAGAETTAYLPLRALPQSLAPDTLKYATDNFIFRQVTSGLYVIGEGFQVNPHLVDQATWDSKRRKLSLSIRTAKWSDGTDVQLRDVVDALERCVKSSKKTLLSSVTSIDGFEEFMTGKSKKLSGIVSTGERGIDIHVKMDAPLLVDDLAQAECHLIKPGPGGTLDLSQGAIGVGPYRFGGISGDEVKLTRNPYYFLKNDGPDTVILRKTPHFGDFDQLKTWVTMTTTEMTPKTTDPEFTKIDASELGSHQLIFNHSKPPFDRIELRRAVALALDIETWAKHVEISAERIQGGLVPFGMRGFEKRDLRQRPKELSEARALLTKLGYNQKNPFRFSIHFSKLTNFEKEVEVWKHVFGDLPILPEFKLVAHSDIISLQNKGEYEAMRVYKYPGSTESHRLLASYLSGSDYNPTRSVAPKCDKLTRSSFSEMDREKRFKLYQKADACLMSHQILVPLASLNPGYVMLRKPWKLKRTNRYLLYPYWTSEWSKQSP